ncbi:MAG: hypothetical protein ACR65R_01395 [Methylomicrobium sp.]
MSKMGARNTGNALLNLWDSAAPQTREQLEWYAGLTEFARNEGENTAALMDAFAMLLNDGESVHEPCNETFATILFSLASQVKTINALIEIGETASYRLEELAKAKPSDQAGDIFATTTNWSNYSLDVSGNRYRFICKSSQEILLQFVAASDDEAEEVCTDYLRRCGLQAHNRQERAKKPD